MRLTVIFVVLLVSLAACGGPSRTPEQEARLAERGPNTVYLSGSRGGPQVLARLSSYTASGIVKSLDVRFQVRDNVRRRSDAIVLPDADIQALHAAVGAENPTSRALLQRAAQQVARATFCPAGPVTLNTGRRGGPPGAVPLSFNPIQVAQHGLPGIQVLLKCDTTNPYFSAARVAQSRQSGPTPAQLRATVVGKTARSFSNAHGTQVEYLSAQGQAHLWYPGNQRVNSGTWRIDGPSGARTYTQICFAYGTRSYNPATGQIGGESCTAAAVFLRRQKQNVAGDVFNLSSGAIPFVMEKGREYTYSDLNVQ